MWNSLSGVSLSGVNSPVVVEASQEVVLEALVGFEVPLARNPAAINTLVENQSRMGANPCFSVLQGVHTVISLQKEDSNQLA